MGLSIDTAKFGRAARWSELVPEVLELAATGRDDRFPGGILPAKDSDGRMLFYAVAETAAAWRKLQPLLQAFAGPTLTDFTGAPVPPEADPLSGELAAAGATVVARLRPGSFPNAEAAVVRALRRLQAMMAESPDLAVARPEPTARLLAGLQDALNGGDVEQAWRILSQLREELRLDALNLAQLEMQILATAGDWSAVRWHDRFETLIFSGPSPATAEILLEAIYWTAAFDPETGAPRGREVLCADEAAQFIAPLLAIAPHPGSAAVELLRQAVEGPVAAPPSIAEFVDAPSPEVAPALYAAGDPVSAAQSALLAAAMQGADGTPETDVALLQAVERLEPAARESLLARPMFRGLWLEVMARSGELGPPRDWSDWLTRLEDSTFDATAAAVRGARDWRLPDADIDPAMGLALATRIADVPEGLAEERLGEALPYLVQWATSDPHWPRQAFRSAYLALLVRIALGARRGESVLRSAASLLDGALRSGLSIAEYREAVDAAEAVCLEGLHRTSAYDVLEVVDTVRGVAPMDPERLERFTVRVIAALHSLSGRLSEGQRLAISALAREVGLEHADVSPAQTGAAPILGALAGKVLGVYTLTETAGRQAEEMLRAAIPGVVVDLNHDHGGSSALAAMASRADLVVVAWASAKHAATEFIKAKRGAKPLVYAAGKGSTSICRAVEEWAAREYSAAA